MMKLIAPGGNRIRQPTHSLALWVDYTRHLQSETAALQGGGAVLAATKDLSLELGLSVPPSPSSVLDWVRSSASSFLSLSSSPCFPFLLSLSTATFPSLVVFPRGETRINGRLFRDVICPALPSSNSIPSELIPGADLEFASSCSHEEWNRRGWDGTGPGEKRRER